MYQTTNPRAAHTILLLANTCNIIIQVQEKLVILKSTGITIIKLF